MKIRKMDMDDKKKAFAYGVLMWMAFIIVYFLLIHERLGGDRASWVVVDSIIFGSGLLCFGIGLCIAKLQAGEMHASEIEYRHKKYDD